MIFLVKILSFVTPREQNKRAVFVYVKRPKFKK